MVTGRVGTARAKGINLIHTDSGEVKYQRDEVVQQVRLTDSHSCQSLVLNMHHMYVKVVYH